VNFEQPTPLSEYRPDAPPAFEQVLLQALEKDRDRRYANVALFAAALAPFTTPRAAAYAERVAGVLGEQVAPARPTVELEPEPVAVMPLRRRRRRPRRPSCGRPPPRPPRSGARGCSPWPCSVCSGSVRRGSLVGAVAARREPRRGR
jgi:hypothetical protein